MRETLSSLMKDSNRESILTARSYENTGPWLFEMLIFSPLAYFTRTLPPKFSGRPWVLEWYPFPLARPNSFTMSTRSGITSLSIRARDDFLGPLHSVTFERCTKVPFLPRTAYAEMYQSLSLLSYFGGRTTTENDESTSKRVISFERISFGAFVSR